MKPPRKTLFNKGDRVVHQSHYVKGTVIDHSAISVNVQWDRPCDGKMLSTGLPRSIKANAIIKPEP